MNQLEIIQKINMLTSSFMEQNKESMTLKEYIDNNYIPEQKYQKNDKNFRHLLNRLRVLLSKSIVDIPINMINENDIIKVLAELKVTRIIKDSTLNRYRSLLHHIFSCALKSKILLSNPVSCVKKHQEQPRTRTITSYEIDLLLSKCEESKNPELIFIVLVALYTGMRFSNIVNMRKSRIINNEYFIPADENKSRKDLRIPLNEDLILILNDFIKSHPNGDMIFKSKSVRTSFKNALKKANIHDFRFHDIRRVFATTLLTNGADIRIIQELLGHSSITVTEVYLACNDKKKLDEINKLCFINNSY